MPSFLPSLLLLATVAGWNGSDDFRGTALNSCNWENTSVDGNVSLNDRLLLTTRGDRRFSSASVRTQYFLTSDFDFSVGYELMEGWEAPIVPTGSGPRIDITINLLIDGGARHFAIIRGKSTGGEFINLHTSVPGLESYNGFSLPAANRKGTFRLTRRSGQIEILHHDGSSWRSLAIVNGLTAPVHVSLSALSIDVNNGFTASFDNFNLSFGTTSSRAWTRPQAFRSRSDLYLGGVVTDFLARRTWGTDWQLVNPLDTMKANGIEWVRVGVVTTSSSILNTTPPGQWRALGWRDEYWSSFEFAAEILRQARDRGFRLEVFYYLSHTAANAGQQFPPPAWANLSVDQTAAELERYTFETTSRFRALGLPIEIYDIGNEIETGILGFRPGDRIPIPPGGVDIWRNLDWMRNNVWNIEARLLAAAARGVRRADPNARIVLHITGLTVGEGNAFPLAFFRAMIDEGVLFDYAGLSHPNPVVPWNLDAYSTDCWFQRLDDLVNGLATMGKKTIFSEAAYPSRQVGVQAAAMKEFPYSPAGQAAWTREQLRFASSSENVAGWFWFYPDYYPGSNMPVELQYSGLFTSEFDPAPALAEFRVNLAKLSASATRDSSDPLAVAFRASLSGAVAQSYRWSLGDGSVSTEANPRYRYGAPGTYHWLLIVETNAGTVSSEGTLSVGPARRRSVRR